MHPLNFRSIGFSAIIDFVNTQKFSQATNVVQTSPKLAQMICRLSLTNLSTVYGVLISDSVRWSRAMENGGKAAKKDIRPYVSNTTSIYTELGGLTQNSAQRESVENCAIQPLGGIRNKETRFFCSLSFMLSV